MGSIGGSGSKQSSSSTSTSNTYESPLSKEQLKILQQRSAEFESFWLPKIQQTLTEGLAESSVGSKSFNAGLSANAQQVNQAFNSAQANTTQSLAQQGQMGNYSGVASALKAQNERARASALAQAYNQQVQQSEGNKMKYAELLTTAGAALSPQPTTSAEYLQTSTSKSKSSGVSAGGQLTIL